MAIIYFLLGILFIVIIYLLYYVFNSNSIIQKEFQRQLEAKYNAIQYEIKNYEKTRADSILREWQIENEVGIRKDAIAIHSDRITTEISEETAFFNENFSFNPRDIKFIGKYIDLVVFEGSAEENEVSIYFLDIRKNNSAASEYKMKVKEAIDNKRFNWREISI